MTSKAKNTFKIKMKPNNSDNMFCKVMTTRRSNVTKWLCSKYSSLSIEDVEDIVQESSMDLWIWIKDQDVTGWHEADYVRLWIAFCKNKCTHWLRKNSKFTKLNNSTNCIIAENSNDNIQLMKREIFYSYIDKMNNRDNTLLQMLLEGAGNDTICKTLGLKNKAVLKNIKCRIITRMKRDLVRYENISFFQSA